LIPRSDKNRSPPETRILGTLAHAYCAVDSAIVVALAVNVDFVTALPRSATGAVVVAFESVGADLRPAQTFRAEISAHGRKKKLRSQEWFGRNDRDRFIYRS